LNKVDFMYKKSDILTEVRSVFKELAGVSFTFKEESDSYKDASVSIKCKGTLWHFDAEIKATINIPAIAIIQQKLSQYKNSPLLIASYISSEMGSYLRSINVNYIDTAGNAYIYTPPMIINIQGNKPSGIKPQINRMYRPSGLKFIFTLLCNPGIENSDYRTLSKISGVALGSVGWIMGDLKQNGFIKVLNVDQLQLVKKETLLKEWVSNYHDQLRPKIYLGIYSSINEDWYKKINVNENLLWGSEYAANILTMYLKPEVFTLYTKDLTSEFLIKNKIHKTQDGNIEILQKFWSFDDKWTNQNVVPPLLIYADLIASKSDRNIETARIIYDKELARIIE